MNKTLLHSLLFGILSSVTVACSNQDEPEGRVISDYNSIEFEISVTNAAGDNLLNPDFEGNILDCENYMIIDGEKDDIKQEYPFPRISPESRFLYPKWYGACIAPEPYPFGKPASENKIFIGGFFGDKNDKVKIELVLNGVSHTLSFSNLLIKKRIIYRHYYLDGVEQESGEVSIVL